jgi:hypothetical protein
MKSELQRAQSSDDNENNQVPGDVVQALPETASRHGEPWMSIVDDADGEILARTPRLASRGREAKPPSLVIGAKVGVFRFRRRTRGATR